jgi:SAM-dependent methyltransferase
VPDRVSPLTDSIARQYGEWIYPRPIMDLAEVAGGHETADPSLFGRLFWPDRGPPEPLDILVAGCGANQAAHLAFRNPTARVVGIDVSSAALTHEDYLKTKHRLTNLELLMLPIEDVASLGRRFDLVASTGVLHHMADPLAGARALGSVLKPDGVVVLMLYARYGRVGLEMLHHLFKRLDLKQDKPSLAIVKETLGRLPPSHPARARLAIDDMRHDGGIIDLFLNARERSYTVADCLDLVAAAGLAFQGWCNNSLYYPDLWLDRASSIYRAIEQLPEHEIWTAMETIVGLELGQHYFVACRADRPRSQYAVDIRGPEFLDYVPAWLYPCGVTAEGPAALLNRGAKIPITPAQTPLARSVDGARSIRGLLAQVPGVSEGFTREFFRALWRAGMVAFQLPAQGAKS